MSDLAATINRYVGRPWNAHGFNCWEFVRAVYSDAYAIVLPSLPGVDGSDAMASANAMNDLRSGGDWLPVAMPRDGDAVTMGRVRHPHHVGIIFEGRIAHCDQFHGVVVQPLAAMRAMGWCGMSYFHHRMIP